MTESIMDRQTKSVLEKLAELGGAQTKEDDLIFEGTKVVLPRRWTPQEGVRFLERWIESQEETANFIRQFKYRPNDGAAAVQRALRSMFGTSGIGRPIFSFFGVEYPPIETIDVGWGETMQVSKGWIDLPMLNGRINIGATQDVDAGTIFQIIAQVPKKHGPIIDGLFRLVEDELRVNSIYKAKAVNGAETPQFINPWTIDPAKVVYSEDVQAQLEANVWTVIKHTARLRDLGIPLKRSVLLAGEFGTGKSLAAMLTAQECDRNEWTFIQVRPDDNLEDAMATAVLYAPTVVFYEDVDTIADDGDPEAVARLLDMFDGIGAKGQDVMVVLTTNHVDRIHKGMLRPGRLDSIIEFKSLDQVGVEKLIKSLLPSAKLSDDIDWAAVHEEMEGYLPAFIKEATERAVRYAIARNDGEPDVLETKDLVNAARGLRYQYDLMNGASEGKTKPTLDRSFEAVVDRAVEQRLDGGKFEDRDGDFMYRFRVNDEALNGSMYGQ